MSDFTPVPPTRVAGSGNPPLDMDNTALELTAMGGTYNVLNSSYSGGADPTGTNDSTAAIQAAINAAPDGQPVTLPRGVYKTSSPLSLTPGTILQGASGWSAGTWGDVGTVIKPSAVFSGTEVIYMPDVSSAVTQGMVIRNIGIDGTSLPGTTDGIRAFGPVNQAVLEEVYVVNCTGIGLNQVTDSGVSSGSKTPYGWRLRHVLISNCAQDGAVLAGQTDSTWEDVHIIGCGSSSGNGLTISGSPANSMFTNVRVEWTGTGDGWHLTGAWNTGTGSGPFIMSGCSSDRNNQNGIYCNATGTTPVIANGCMFRRDGRNAGSGGGSYAGIQASSATVPMFFSNVAVFPGVDDNGSGTNSPQYGASVASSTTVQILSGYLQGATAGTNGTTASAFLIAPNVIVANGTTGGPTTQLTDLYRQASGILQTDNAIQVPNSFVSATRFIVGGITGATAGCRLVGAIASGTAPASGTFVTGDMIIVLTGSIIVCTAGGTPGTWVVIT